MPRLTIAWVQYTFYHPPSWTSLHCWARCDVKTNIKATSAAGLATRYTNLDLVKITGFFENGAMNAHDHLPDCAYNSLNERYSIAIHNENSNLVLFNTDL
jgi:hypothetical protein